MGLVSNLDRRLRAVRRRLGPPPPEPDPETVEDEERSFAVLEAAVAAYHDGDLLPDWLSAEERAEAIHLQDVLIPAYHELLDEQDGALPLTWMGGEIESG